MMSLRLLLWLLSSLLQMRQSIAHAARDDSGYETYTTDGGPTSQLFSQCIAEAMSVEGSLYSVAVTEGEEYIRFVPNETLEVNWTAVDLGSTPNTIQCAEKAFELGANMFQFDGDCKVSETSPYDLSGDQGCDGDVVYITNKESESTDGTIDPVEENEGCLVSTDSGITFGDDEGRLLDDAVMPPEETCCPHSSQEFCVVLDKREILVSVCEAEYRCKARGMEIASRSFVENTQALNNLALIGINERFAMIGVRRDEDGVWRWTEDGSEFENITWREDPVDGEDCAKFGTSTYYGSNSPTPYFSISCTENQDTPTLCYNPTSSLPTCA